MWLVDASAIWSVFRQVAWFSRIGARLQGFMVSYLITYVVCAMVCVMVHKGSETLIRVSQCELKSDNLRHKLFITKIEQDKILKVFFVSYIYSGFQV